VLAGQLIALAVANARYWPTVHPVVQRELRGWRQHAERIPDERRRALALGKLDHAGAHALITATLATLAPRCHRQHATIAIVALEVMYDYLDALTETGVDLASGREIFTALPAPFEAGSPQDPYLRALAERCGEQVRALPAFDAIAPIAVEIAVRCGEAQIRSHLATIDREQLRSWAVAHRLPGLTWWECAGGFAASVLAVHALISAAADRRTAGDEARSLADAYRFACTLTTMLDSLVDRELDAATGAHSFIAYYESAEIAARLAYLAVAAVGSVRAQRHGAHHAMTVAGIAGYYLSDPAVGTEGRSARDALEPIVSPIVWMFKAWRASCRLRHRCRRTSFPAPTRSPGGVRQ